MSTFIKTGLWETSTATQVPKGWLNLTKLIKDNSGGTTGNYIPLSGTDIRYNSSTLSLELYNADNELLDSIPVSSFIGSVGTQLQLNSNELQLRDSQGNVLSTVSFAVSNIDGLQTILNNKLDKGTYIGTAQDLKNSIDSKIATAKTEVKNEILGSASAAYDTLQEIQAQMEADDTAAASLTTAVGQRPTYTETGDLDTDLVQLYNTAKA